MSALQSARALAAAGVPVFPCNSLKRPACPHGFKDAAIGESEVSGLWQRFPGLLVGVPTGTASGLDVLDIDPHHGGDRWWIAYMHRIPAIRMHRTGSGGLHVLFRHHERVRNTESKVAPGVDTRGEGGYAIWWPAAGCAVVEAPVAPWPEWLLRRVLKRPRKVAQPARTYQPLDNGDAAQRIAERVLSRLEQAQEGQRHYTLRKAAYTIGGLLDRLPFGEAEAAARLVQAVEKAGAADLVNARKTADWGISCGQVAPMKMGAR